jgi:hypothetical protein
MRQIRVQAYPLDLQLGEQDGKPIMRAREALNKSAFCFPGLKPRSIYNSLDAGLKAGSTRTSTCSEFP